MARHRIGCRCRGKYGFPICGRIVRFYNATLSSVKEKLRWGSPIAGDQNRGERYAGRAGCRVLIACRKGFAELH